MENEIDHNININLNDNNFNHKNLYLKQEEEIINNYNEKRNKIKISFDMMFQRYQINQDFYEQFINLIKDYKEIKLKNIENLNNLLNKYFKDDNKYNKKSENNQIETIKSEFKEIIKNQINAEKDKINQLNLEDKFKNIEEDLNNSKKLLNDLNNIYNSYINSINDIEKKHLSYLKYFNEYEMKIIDLVYKNFKNNQISFNNNKQNNNNIEKKENNNNCMNINDFLYDEDEQKEFNEMTYKLLKKEKRYRKLLKDYDESIHPKYLEFKKCIENLSIYHNDFIEQENQLFTFVYLGYIISIETQHNYQKKELNFENLTSINFQNYKELNQLFESITFEQYKTLVISSNKDDYNLYKELPQEIIIKLSYILNFYFSYIPKLEKGDFDEPKIKFISAIIQKLFTDNLISKEEESNIINILKKNKYRLIFLKTLNEYRSIGKFDLSCKNLIILGNIVRTITDLYDIKHKDYDVLNLLIIMCQTYYTINNKKKKVYLLRFIEDHDLFQSEEIWEYFIEESINREIQRKNKNEDEDLLLDEEIQNSKKCNIYFTVLLSATQNILEFQIDKEVIKKIMVNLIDKKYNLIPIYIEQILSLIEETVYEKRKKFNVNIDILGKSQ